MTNPQNSQWHPANPEKLARQFTRFGRIGFWLQVALLVIPIVLFVYVMFFAAPESPQRRGIDLSNYLSVGSLAVMVFTTYWFYRYTRIGPKIADPDTRPTQAAVVRTLWIGVGAGFIGIVLSMVLMMSAVGRFVVILLTTPQTGIPIAAAGGDNPGTTLSAIDAISLKNLLLSLTGEQLVLALSLWLLFQVSRVSVEPTDDAS